MKAAIYTRISKDDEGEGLGVERQRKDCLELAARLGWQVVAEYPENDTSASTNNTKARPQYERMLADIRSGKVDAVLSYSNSRLTRRPMELEDLITLHANTGARFATVVSGSDDLSTADGRMVARIKASVDAAEAERVAERVRRKHAELRMSGRMVGARSFGWAVTPDGRLSGDLNPEEAALLKDAAQRILSGGSIYQIAQEWNKKGITTTKGGRWSHGNLRTTLKNPKMAGFRAHRGEVVRDDNGKPVQGQWKPILSVKKWEQLCAVLNRKRHMRAGATRHLLGGLIRCECGAVMYGQTKTDHRSKAKVEGYDCSGCTAFIVKSKVEPKVLEALASSVLLGPADGLATGPATSTLTKRLNGLRKADTRLLDAYTQGVYSLSEVATKRAQIAAELDEVNAELDAQVAAAAQQSLVTQSWRELWSGPKPSFESAAQAKKDIRARIAEMEFHRLREVVSGSLTITVRRGRGSNRVHIHHLRVPSLNEAS